jgi:hypothetical protein
MKGRGNERKQEETAENRRIDKILSKRKGNQQKGFEQK